MKEGKAILQLCDFSLRYSFATQPALRDLSLTIWPGERMLLLGPSGSGKSSFACAAAGLIPEHVFAKRSGSILLDGKDPASLAPLERARLVSIVFQDPETQFCTLSVEDEIAFGLENQAASPPDIERKIEQVTDQLGIERLRKQRLDRLSGGEKQLVALACSLVLEPRLVILDEITAHLDGDNTSLVYGCVRQLLEANRDTAVVIVEHRIDQVKDLVHRVVVLQRNGSLLLDGERDMVFCEHRELLKEHGVWIPEVTYADLRTNLRQAGFGEQPLLVCNRLSFAYAGAFRRLKSPATSGLLRTLSFVLFPGEILAVLGANGSGKTTLLWLLAGLLEPNAGEVLLAGKNPAKLSGPQISRLCGLVFQNPEHHFVTDTVFEEIALSLRLQTRDVHEIRCRTQRLLAQVDLAWAAQMNPFELSWGEKRRLSVAAAMACGCRVLLLDEPTFGQDLAGTYSLAQLMLQLRHEGVALLMVTHDRALACAIADRALEFVEGGLQESFTRAVAQGGG